jgi:hypothetical protein
MSPRATRNVTCCSRKLERFSLTWNILVLQATFTPRACARRVTIMNCAGNFYWRLASWRCDWWHACRSALKRYAVTWESSWFFVSTSALLSPCESTLIAQNRQIVRINPGHMLSICSGKNTDLHTHEINRLEVYYESIDWISIFRRNKC